MEYFRGGVFVECDEATYERQYKGLGFIPFNKVEAPKEAPRIIAETDETPEAVPEVQPKRNYNKKK